MVEFENSMHLLSDESEIVWFFFASLRLRGKLFLPRRRKDAKLRIEPPLQVALANLGRGGRLDHLIALAAKKRITANEIEYHRKDRNRQ